MEKKFTRFNKLKTGERKIRRYRDGAVGSFPSVRNGTFFRTFCYFLITFCFAIRVWNWKLDTVTWIWYSNTFDILSFNFYFIFAINCILWGCPVCNNVDWYFCWYFKEENVASSGTKQKFEIKNRDHLHLNIRILILIWIFLFYFIDNTLFAIFNLLQFMNTFVYSKE